MTYGSQPDSLDSGETKNESEAMRSSPKLSAQKSAGHRGLYSLDVKDEFESGIDHEGATDPDYILSSDWYSEINAAHYDLLKTGEEANQEIGAAPVDDEATGAHAIGYRNGHTYTYGNPPSHGHSTDQGQSQPANDWSKWTPSTQTDDPVQDLPADTDSLYTEDVEWTVAETLEEEDLPSSQPDWGPEDSSGEGLESSVSMDNIETDYTEADYTEAGNPDPYPVEPRQVNAGQGVADQQNASSVLDLDPRFQDAIAKMQAGVWPEVVTILYQLQDDYPQAALLTSLINEAELKASLVNDWGEKIKGRRLTVRQQYWLRKSIPYMLVLLLFVGGGAFYQTFVAPSRQVMAMARASENMLEEAQTLIQSGRYDEAIDIYNSILVVQPDNAGAQTGRDDATKLAKHGAYYQMAKEIADAGNIERALSLLRGIQVESPNFRDVEAKIAEYEDLKGAQGVFAQAEEAYQTQRWLDALDLYTQAQQIDSDYQRDVVDIRLPEVYLHAGRMLLSQRPHSTGTLAQAREYLRKGIAFNHDAASTAADQLDAYEGGVLARENGDLDLAISRWRTLYDQEPQFLGGLLADQLYYIYLVHGTDAAARGDFTYAASLFEEATQLDVPDTSEAEKRLAIVSQA